MFRLRGEEAVTENRLLLFSQSCLTLCNPLNCSTPGFPALHYLLEFAQAHVYWVDDAIQPCHPLSLLLLLPSIFLSIMVFSSESVLHIEWPKYCSFSFSISPSNEYSGFISFRIYWFGLLVVQKTIKSPPAPQFESNKWRCSKLKEKWNVAPCSTCTYKNLPVFIFSHIFNSLTWIYSAKHLL